MNNKTVKNNMMGFVEDARALPAVRGAEKRTSDFDEIYQRFEDPQAQNQANRCEQCGVPFCQVGCPLNNAIPNWLMLTSKGRMREAFALLQMTTDFPEVCGRICPQDRLCEGACVIEVAEHGAVTIGSVETYIAEYAWDKGWITPIQPPKKPTGKKVAIIGSGPAGLAAAAMLLRHGVKPVIFERSDRAGGLMIYGIPSFKLEKKIVQRRVDWLTASGATFKLNTEVGKDITFSKLQTEYDAVLIATGVYQAKNLMLQEGPKENSKEQSKQIVPALEFLIHNNRLNLGDASQSQDKARLDAKGRSVLVLGGGDTAQDCVRSAIRMGATKVTCAYRRDRENMPGSRAEVKNSIDEGVIFEWLSSPVSYRPKQKTIEVVMQKMRLVADKPGERLRPQAVQGKTSSHNVDMVIEALGFEAEDMHKFMSPKLSLSPSGTVIVSSQEQLRTNLDNVYAAGDIVRGAALVVEALADGRKAALSILKDMGIIHRPNINAA